MHTYADPVHRPRRNARTGLLTAVAVLLPAVAAVFSGTLQVTRCVSVPGGVAQVGINLALLRPAAECPTTGLALGGESEQVLAVVILLTLPMLLLHAGVLAGSWGAVAVVRRSLARLAQLTPWRRLPTAGTLQVPAHRPAAVGILSVPAVRTPGATPLLRGPPALLPA